MIKNIDKSNPRSLINYITDQKINLSKDAKFNLIFKFSSMYSIVLLCNLFKVSRSGYYKWRNRKLNPKPNPDLITKKHIIEMQLLSESTTGYRKMFIHLTQNKNMNITKYKTYSIMKKYGLLSKSIHSKKIPLLIVIWLSITT